LWELAVIWSKFEIV